ncbi:tryptophan synthase subunit alpha [Corynebacterium guangdongense]|uniref:Tryptophan synthase alpha chain n=1 Tax=Corynebacterium guangdongense TaxID=1783348 RepID=A0ABU2A069_9CORY|nr:tryptophan synthase subunit alpha [Corynebacterium guangdongense]MDR7330570.1 tryptophan synthase alpha chain [Corynebacterium guangdongense]WJZ19124.1 Tryptophan synthase alpha chain [Corynebacterium guangdongense]
MSRYEKAFAALKEKNEGAFVPFYMLSDPSPADAVEIISAAVEAGADALELGVPFSDPIADGPTVQKSHTRALDGGATVAMALDQIRQLRERFPEIPIGMLIYSNVPYVRGLENFYAEFKEAGADSILLPDIPVREGRPFHDAAVAAGIDPIFIAPYQASEETLEGVAAMSKGYIYAVSRDGVTGAENQASVEGLDKAVQNVERFGGAPVVLGFGISTPEHVNDAIRAGAAGAITGSALAKIVDKYVEYEHPNPGRVTDMAALKAEVTEFVAAMKAATKL